MNKSRLLCSLTVSIFTFLASASPALAVDLPVTADTFINGNRPDSNKGENSDIKIKQNVLKFGLAQFDITSAQNGSDVDAATLKLFVNVVANSGTIDLHLIEESWEEGTVTFASAPLYGAPFASVPVGASDEGSIVTADVTSAVEKWLTNPATNYGIALSSTNGNFSLDSKEKPGGTPMEIAVDLPPPVTLAIIPTDYPTLADAVAEIGQSWCPEESVECTIYFEPGRYQSAALNSWGNFSDPIYSHGEYGSRLPRLILTGAGEQATTLEGSIDIGIPEECCIYGTFEFRNLTINGRINSHAQGEVHTGIIQSTVFGGVDRDISWGNGNIFISRSHIEGNVDISNEPAEGGHSGIIRHSTVDGSVIGWEGVSYTIENSTITGDLSANEGGFDIRNSLVQGDMRLYDYSDTDINNSTVGNIAAKTGAKVSATNSIISSVETSYANSIVIGNSVLNTLGTIEPSTWPTEIKCTNVLDQNFDLRAPDCTELP